MPRIDNILPVTYDAEWAYDSYYDNLPLGNMLARISLVNTAVDQNEEILRSAMGTAGTLANRLDQSLDDDGDLISAAVDDALHNIGAHADGEWEGVEYVRMTQAESDKLQLIADEATAFTLTVGDVDLDSTCSLIDSSSIVWTLVSGNQIRGDFSFPTETAHIHYYNITPVQAEEPADYINYFVSISPQEYMEGSLRVFVNGIRISDTGVYVYGEDGPTGTWTLLSVTEDYENGGFTLSRAITSSDVIVIDFDIAQA